MKILLLGASGLLGSAVARTALSRVRQRITGLTHTWGDVPLPGLTSQVTADLADGPVVNHLLEQMQPTVIINAAAIADPGRCESEPVLSQQLNADLPARLAAFSRQSGARLIHLSSEQVFDGTAPPYRMGDAVHGINRYARQKIEGEQRVRATDASAVILRIPLLLGNSLSGRRSVHERLLELWSRGGTARLYADEIRQTCTADSVAQAIDGILSRPDLGGIFHWAGAEPLSRFQIAEKIRTRFALTPNRARIEPVERKNDPAALASRPADLSLDLEPLASLLAVKPQSADDAMAELAPPVWWHPSN